MADDPVRMMQAEFELWGVKFQHCTRGSGHIELRWQVSPAKEVRTHIVAKTPSDHRWFMNERAAIRRMFRADGLVLKEQVMQRPKPPGKLEKALTAPAHVVTTDDQIRMMRAEIADLSELVLTLRDRLEDVLTAPVRPAPETPPLEPSPIVEKMSTRSKKAIEYVSANWNSVEALARDMDLPLKIALRKLNYLVKTGEVEIKRGQCRLMPKPEPISAAPEPMPEPPAPAPALEIALPAFLPKKQSKAVAPSTIERRKARQEKALAIVKGMKPKHVNGHGAN
jgi:hypothetical protein